MAASLNQLPQEVVYNVFLHVPPTSVPTLQLVCHRFHDISLPILWRHHCQTQFEYWDPRHDIQNKLHVEVEKTDWKKLFAERHSTDRDVSRGIDNILASQNDRVPKTKSIVVHGYDTKDTLLRHLNVNREVEDVLARRYYTSQLLGCQHRTVAVQEWIKILTGEFVPLERALGAFNMFVLQDKHGDYDEITAKLDEISKQFRQEKPDYMELNTKGKAYALAEYLKSHDLISIKDDVDAHYHDLQNNFIGLALFSEDHPSLPLVSVAIYCCVAQRLGLDAHPCGFPFHVLAIVRPPVGQSADGRDLESDLEWGKQWIYMDPFRSSTEALQSDLTAQLVSMGVPQNAHASLLDISSTTAIVQRSAKNIITSVQTLHRGNGVTSKGSTLDVDSAFYAALLTLVILDEGNTEPRMMGIRRGRYVPYLLKLLHGPFPLDVCMIRDYILPLFESAQDGGELRDGLEALLLNDSTPKVVKERSPEALTAVRYKVGQIFHHKRYHYRAAIVGWDVQCALSEDWMSQMGVHDLPRGKYQSFYHALVEDNSTRYVAEENIEIVEQDPSEQLMALAGKYFKRWDQNTKSFVSNIKDEYPDD